MRIRRTRRWRTGLAAVALLFSPCLARATAKPRIVNGLTSTDFPAVGALITSFEPQSEYCSGTLIGCRTFLVAAHCVCPEGQLNAADCLRIGTDDPRDLLVFFQNAGFFEVQSIAINPTFEFETGGDVAVLTLTEPVEGIRPAALERAGSPALGTKGTLVGFGITGNDKFDTGVKRAGEMVSGVCPINITPANHICWEFTDPLGPPGIDSNTCDGDSGGPLFVAGASGPVLAGVTSGGEPGCETGSVSWNSDVFSNLAFIDAAAGSDLSQESCGPLPPVEGPGTSQFARTGMLSRSHVSERYSFEVPAGTVQLRVALNGEDNEGAFRPMWNDFDLYVRRGGEPTLESFDCADRTIGTYGYCEFNSPQSGTWNVLVEQDSGGGTFQLVATMFSSKAVCTGDCGGDGEVTVDEILIGVNIALGEAQPQSCPNFDADSSGSVTVDEILTAVNHALTGC